MAVMLVSGQRSLIFITWATPQRCLSILTAWQLLSPKVFFCPKDWGRLFLFKMSLVIVCFLNTIVFVAPPPIKRKTYFLEKMVPGREQGFVPVPPHYSWLILTMKSAQCGLHPFLSRLWSWLTGGKRLTRLGAEMGSILVSRYHPEQILWFPALRFWENWGIKWGWGLCCPCLNPPQNCCFVLGQALCLSMIHGRYLQTCHLYSHHMMSLLLPFVELRGKSKLWEELWVLYSQCQLAIC